MPARRRLPFCEAMHRLSVAHLLVALVMMFVVLPFVDNFRYGPLMEAMTFTAVLLAAMNAIGRRRGTLVLAGLIMAPALATKWIDHLYPNLLPRGPSQVAAVVFVAFVIWHLLRFVMSSPKVTSEVLCAVLSIYLLFAVAWAFLYTLLALSNSNAFTFTVPSLANASMTGFTALYFSFESLTTLAFGDIMPVSNVARMMTLVEATGGIFYVTILIARLLGCIRLRNRSRKPRIVKNSRARTSDSKRSSPCSYLLTKICTCRVSSDR